MNPDELAQMLTSMRMAHDLAQAMRDPRVQSARGWDLGRWRCDEADDAVRFVHHSARGQPDVALLCVQRAEGAEWVYEAALRLSPCPTRLLVLKA